MSKELMGFKLRDVDSLKDCPLNSGLWDLSTISVMYFPGACAALIGLSCKIWVSLKLTSNWLVILNVFVLIRSAFNPARCIDPGSTHGMCSRAPKESNNSINSHRCCWMGILNYGKVKKKFNHIMFHSRHGELINHAG